MNETSLQHPHLKSARFVAIINRDHSIRSVLRVETDLPTSVDDPAYRKAEMGSLTEMLALYMNKNMAIDAVEVSRIGY